MSNSPRTTYVLDEWREPLHGVRIAIECWHTLCRVEDQFIERGRSIRLVWQYLRHIGPLAVWRKIRSRLAERDRNHKVAAVGRGIVLEAPEGSVWKPGDRVVFFAPNHSEQQPRICVDERFIMPAGKLGAVSDDNLKTGTLPPELEPYVGWSVFSGVDVDREQVRRGLSRLSGLLSSTSITRERARRVVKDVPVTERLGQCQPRPGRPSAVLFGLGNYAKTQIVPNIRRWVNLCCVHEIDPDQLCYAARWGVVLDTSPFPREGERYDVWFIAGYHHTHAPLAIRALKDGSYAVVEKPLVTSWEQYRELRKVVETSTEPRLFACFQKRYSKVNEWVRADLCVDSGEPVDMHCIVYEIPLPRLHWYNWPTSGSRIISNGCHWLDYFLFMNDYCRVEEAGLWAARAGGLAVFVRLENGAVFVMSLTERGSARLGVRDVIELRARDATVRITDGAFYEAENTKRVLRRRRINPMDAYRRMYDEICQRIVSGKSGDNVKTLRSTELMLHIEDEFQAKHSRR